MGTTTLNWFDLYSGFNDLDIVIGFIENLPKNLKEIIQQEGFINLVNDDEDYGITYSLFLESFEEAESVLNSNILAFKRNITIENTFGRSTRNFAEIFIEQNGFTGASLKLKAKILEKFWVKVENAGGRIMDFSSKPLVRYLRKFLGHLNSILGSLTGLIPGIDAIKEIKDIIESYLNFADE